MGINLVNTVKEHQSNVTVTVLLGVVVTSQLRVVAIRTVLPVRVMTILLGDEVVVTVMLIVVVTAEMLLGLVVTVLLCVGEIVTALVILGVIMPMVSVLLKLFIGVEVSQ